LEFHCLKNKQKTANKKLNTHKAASIHFPDFSVHLLNNKMFYKKILVGLVLRIIMMKKFVFS